MSRRAAILSLGPCTGWVYTWRVDDEARSGRSHEHRWRQGAQETAADAEKIGEALAAVRGSSLADAAVMASAALRGGGVVYTSDPEDLGRLQVHFPTVRLVAI